MSACAAFGCTNRPQKKVPGITFHKFPNDATLRNEWLLAIRRVNFRPSKYSRLCSEHFSEDQIDRTSLACVRLRANAVPNIFQGYPKNIQKKLEQLTSEKEMSDLKRKSFAEEEDENSFSDEGLENTQLSSDMEQINSSDLDFSCKEEIYMSHISKATNKKQCKRPNILRIIPAEVYWLSFKGTNLCLKLLRIILVPKFLTSNNLNPDLIDALTASHRTEYSNNTVESIINSSLNSNNELPNEVLLQRKVRRLEEMNLNYKKKIRILQQQNRRQKVRIEALKERIKNLENNQTSDEDVSEDFISEDEIYKELLKYQMEYNDEDYDS
ncbi:THAP-type domain-containing protein [Trichonephila inaurata madagascariensis]|uniref:THAP-type domain-containing protein n=1 Tax=Trichonephila inaurata madagascariensis TaxID=2747483 RepID=A0A8X6XV41_9ARAC|nr:THAP-type domain-containing protein [Trichonephila inaurata madagascariensis]